MQQVDKNNVPRDTADPIQYLLDNGASVIELALAWGFKTTDTVYRLKRFQYTPPPATAVRMAESFGWTAGDVINHWLERVEQKAVSR